VQDLSFGVRVRGLGFRVQGMGLGCEVLQRHGMMFWASSDLRENMDSKISQFQDKAVLAILFSKVVLLIPFLVLNIQGYLAHKTPPPCRTLQ
jgi:hypothetical protein